MLHLIGKNPKPRIPFPEILARSNQQARRSYGHRKILKKRLKKKKKKSPIKYVHSMVLPPPLDTPPLPLANNHSGSEDVLPEDVDSDEAAILGDMGKEN